MTNTRLGKDRDQQVFYCLSCGGEMLALDPPGVCPYPRCGGREIRAGREARTAALALRSA